MTETKVGLVSTLNGICATLRAMTHKGPCTDQTRVRKKGRPWTKVKGDDILIWSLASEDKPRLVNETKNGYGK